MATEFAFLPLGANLHTFTLKGIPLVISFNDESAYTATGNPAFFGETIGRVGNRIRDATLNLNGTSYTLDRNERNNTLHGGKRGWGKQTWKGPFDDAAPSQTSGNESTDVWAEIERVRFELHSPDGDGGFPGSVDAKTWYTTRASADGTIAEVEVEYEVSFPESSSPKQGAQGEQLDTTVVNVTNHTAFSLGPVAPGGASRSIAGTRVTLATPLRQDVDATSLLPNGAISPHPLVTPGREIELGATSPAFDDCFVLPHARDDPASVPLDTRAGPLRQLMTASHRDTKVSFEAWSTEPAFQFYTGEHIDVQHGGQQYSRRAGFCVEASRFVDAASDDRWRAMVELQRGQVWGSRTVYKAKMA